MNRKSVNKLLYQKLFKVLVLKSDFQKAYYVFEFTYLIKCLINRIIKNKLSSGPFWMDQSSDLIKENINKYMKPEGKGKCIKSFSTNSDGMFKNTKIYYMGGQFQGTGKGIVHDLGRTIINTSAQVGINLKYVSTDDVHFETDINRIKRELRGFNPDYLIVYDRWLYQDIENKLMFLRQMKDELRVKLIVFIEDSHYYGVIKDVSSFVDIADKIISLSSWSPLFSSEKLQSKLSYIQAFNDNKLFFPKVKELDLFFSGVSQFERAPIITFAAFVSDKLKLKTELHVRTPHEEIRAVTNQTIIDDESYMDFMRKSRAAICIGMKGTVENGKNIHIITGRVAESMACGSAVIHYKPKDDTTLNILDNYYTPWKEYLPFSSRKELKDILWLLKYEPDMISEIGQNGRKRYLECYGPVNSWKNILKMPVVG